MTDTRDVTIPDGTTIKIPSTILCRADEPEPVTCERCHTTVSAVKATEIQWQGRYYWQWQYCPCMAEAVAYEKSMREQEQTEAEARKVFRDRQRDFTALFPQWQQSNRVSRQTFETLHESAGNHSAIVAARQWLKAPSAHGMVFRGPVGTGKTHLVRAIAHEVMSQYRTVLYTSVPFLLERLKPNSGVRMDDVLHLHLSADVVIWDDIGAERDTEWTLDRLYLLLDARYEAAKPLVGTTNATPELLREQLGSRITSRLFEMSPVWVVNGADERIAVARRRAQGRITG